MTVAFLAISTENTAQSTTAGNGNTNDWSVEKAPIHFSIDRQDVK